jgi:hypothetical protein
MQDEQPLNGSDARRVRALPVINLAEKAVAGATKRCSADGRDDVRLAERFLGIARRRFLLQDWDEAQVFARLAVECAGRATQGAGMPPSPPDQPDPS